MIWCVFSNCKFTVDDAWYPLPPYICAYNGIPRSEGVSFSPVKGEELMLYTGIMVLTLTSPFT